jgi:signal transduction histidine kinase
VGDRRSQPLEPGPRAREELWVLGELAAEAAHELRNALAVIAASASLIRSPESAQHVAKIERAARVAQGVIDGLMALARGEAVRGAPLGAGPDAPRVVLSDAMAEARKDTPGAPRYVDDVPAGETVRGSEVLLSRMLRVMYENAVQAGARTIETRVARSGDVVAIDVEDDGPGVPEAVRATVFDPLVTTKESGTGLGLALARRVARAHGGDVELVEGERGAHFRITLRA